MTRYAITYRGRKRQTRVVNVGYLKESDHWIYLYRTDEYGEPWFEAINAHTIRSIVRLEDEPTEQIP